jgi:iron(III) transport system ATP-binding protein
MSVALSLKNLCRRYVKDNETFWAVDHVNLDVRPGEFLTFLGPSGCGKTTTLRMIAGFANPTDGSISVDGRDITHLPANERNMGFVFQNYALFPHMKIFDNVAYGLRIRGVSGDELARKVREGLEMVGLGKAEHRYPSQLSGGEQQRVALARVLVLKPSLLLMDEPLSNLDAKLHALRDPPHPAGASGDVPLRDARPEGSAHDVRPHHGDEPRPHRAARHADGAL